MIQQVVHNFQHFVLGNVRWPIPKQQLALFEFLLYTGLKMLSNSKLVAKNSLHVAEAAVILPFLLLLVLV
jgi:hypothetical protein